MSPATFVTIGLLLVWVVASGRAGQVVRAMQGTGAAPTTPPPSPTSGGGSGQQTVPLSSAGRLTYPEAGI